jgi:ubiquinol-cytochrome c reductase cytochrome b subunit
MPGRIVRRATYLQEYHELTHKRGVPFVPSAVWKDILFSGFILLAIAVCAVYFGPFGPGGQPDPTIIQTAPRPDFFLFVAVCAALVLAPVSRDAHLADWPRIGIVVLLALPFVAGEGEKSWKRRPIAVLTILLVAVSLGTLTHLAEHTPWSPVMDAWSSQPIP